MVGSRLYPLARTIEQEESLHSYHSMKRIICPVCGHENAHLGRPEHHDGEDDYSAGWGGRKRLFEREDGTHVILPDNQSPPEGTRDLLGPLEAPANLSTLRERVLEQLATGRYGL